MELINLSDGSLNAPHLDKKGLKKLILLPDYSPSRGILPTGSVAIYDASKHTPDYRYLGSDIGCGMLLARIDSPLKDLEHTGDKTYLRLKENIDGETSLGRGNHFINFYEVEESQDPSFQENEQLVLIHSGSRLFGKRVYEEKLMGQEYIDAHNQAVGNATENRKKLLAILQQETNLGMIPLLDLPHNTISIDNDEREIIYRKGSVHIASGEIAVISSHVGGKAAIVKAKPDIDEIEKSMCHGTGRKFSRSEAKKMIFDFEKLRNNIYIPKSITNKSMQTEAPDCYRKLEAILDRLLPYIEVTQSLRPLSYIGGL